MLSNSTSMAVIWLITQEKTVYQYAVYCSSTVLNYPVMLVFPGILTPVTRNITGTALYYKVLMIKINSVK